MLQAAMAEYQDGDEGAHENIDQGDEHMHSEAEQGSEDEGSEGESFVWEFPDGGHVFEVPAEIEEKDKGSEPASEVAVAISGPKLTTFENVPAFAFLSKIGLTMLPNCPGVGIGIHATTKCWQIRYPADGQASVARSFGHLKKGFVSSSEALLRCLLWVWQQHSAKTRDAPFVRSE